MNPAQPSPADSPYKAISRCWCLAVLAALLSMPLAAAEVLRYPQSYPGNEARDAYALALLQLALDKAGSDLRIQPSTHFMEQSRALAELELNRSVDVVWTMTSNEREARLLPVRIGIDKGLMGWRIALLPRDRQQLFRQVHNRKDLQAFRAGQGHDWPDRQILQHSQLPVVPSSNYESLFLMLKAGRFDYFPRSLLEIEEELQSKNALGLVAEPHLLLHYPTVSYFFVAPNNTRLAAILRRGLERALADGSFNQLFFDYYADVLRRANISQRRIIELDNPLLPATTPLQRSELWLNRQQLLELDSP